MNLLEINFGDTSKGKDWSHDCD